MRYHVASRGKQVQDALRLEASTLATVLQRAMALAPTDSWAGQLLAHSPGGAKGEGLNHSKTSAAGACDSVMASVGRPWRLGLAGLGSRGRKHLETMLSCAATDLIGVADDSPLALESVPSGILKSRTIADLLDSRPDTDGIILALPHDAYHQALLQCTNSEVAILKEKPLARSLPEAALISTIESIAERLVVGVQRRQSLSFRHLKRVLDPHSVRAFSYRYVLGLRREDAAESWRDDALRAGGGAILDMGYHSIDFIVGLLGVPSRVYATLDNKKPQADGDVESAGHIVFEYGSGCIGAISVARYLLPKAEQYSVDTDDVRFEYTTDYGLASISSSESVHLFDPDSGSDLLHRQLHEFIRVRSESHSCHTFSQAIETMVTIEACYDSARSGVPVNPLEQRIA